MTHSASATRLEILDRNAALLKAIYEQTRAMSNRERNFIGRLSNRDREQEEILKQQVRLDYMDLMADSLQLTLSSFEKLKRVV